MVEEDLTASGAGEDADLLNAAHKLAELIEQHMPSAAAAIGVDLKDVSAANLRLADIVASGTGLRVEGGKFTQDINIRGVRQRVRRAVVEGAKPVSVSDRRPSQQRPRPDGHRRAITVGPTSRFRD